MSRRRYQFFVYIMASEWRTIYVGATNDLERRVWEHKNSATPGLTKRYGCDRLVYCEEYGDIRQAIAREKQIKEWRRSEKVWR